MRIPAKPLDQCRVHVAGVGRVGTAVVLALHEAGVGTISCNDPQRFEQEQLETSSYSRRSDLGKPKVHVLERFLDGRSGLTFLPLAASNESPKVETFLQAADLIVSCANRLGARLHVEHAAVRLSGKPCIQASVQDARFAQGGTVSIWMPDRATSCFGCLFPYGKQESPAGRNEVLPPTITRLVASVAANMAVRILVRELTIKQNVFTIDARRSSIEGLSVHPRPRCRICGPPSVQSTACERISRRDE